MVRHTLSVAIVVALMIAAPASSATRPTARAPADKFAKIHTTAILSAISDKLTFKNDVYNTSPFKGCDDVVDIADLNLNDMITTEATRHLETRFTVISVPFDPAGVQKTGFLGALPRSALPKAEGVDAYMVVFGDASISHPGDRAGDPPTGAVLPYLLHAYLSSLHESVERVETAFTIDVIDAKTQKTMLRIRPETMFESNVHTDRDQVCGEKPAAEKKAILKTDLADIVRRKLDNALPTNNLSRIPYKRPFGPGNDN